MDTQRALLAIILSFIILFGYQYLFVGFENPQQPQQVVKELQPAENNQKILDTGGGEGKDAGNQINQSIEPVTAADNASVRKAKDITIRTDYYEAVISDRGGIVRSFILKKHREENSPESPGKQLVLTDEGAPLGFSWGSLVTPEMMYDADRYDIETGAGKKESLLLTAVTPAGMKITRQYDFFPDSYLVHMSVKIQNTTSQVLQGAAQVSQINVPFAPVNSASRFLFSGPAAYINEELKEVKAKEFEEGPISLQGKIDWAGYEGTYFICGIAPVTKNGQTFKMEGTEELARTELIGPLDTLKPGEEKIYEYNVFYGPKKLKTLTAAGFNFEKAVNFGWFDVIAKPTLWLLNFFYHYCHNYGVAIILVTILFKAIFWPITHKGLKSMKNMQKLQPKMVKLKEKYKDDPQQMNREVMNLYKTYKVNPLGGCLPMLLQIPVFFALYKVLLQSIELRHAPFMLWINDLSAPDRLMVGFDIPFLGGLPVLTLLMGASMFIQQKLTPTTADPTQARIMLFLPVIFTFMFLNFASGLVLYWFVNNLLSILQQQMINRQTVSAN